MASETQNYRYLIDAEDRLIGVDALWLAFARENGAAELTAASILGRPLSDFVEGDTIRAVYAEIHDRIRTSGKPASFCFRCDSPLLKRHMRLSISPAEAGKLIYDSRVLWTEPQRNLALLDAGQPRSKSFLTVCSCCRKAMVEPGGWQEIENVARSLGLLETDNVPQLRHTLCPECSQAMRHSIANSDVA